MFNGYHLIRDILIFASVAISSMTISRTLLVYVQRKFVQLGFLAQPRISVLLMQWRS